MGLASPYQKVLAAVCYGSRKMLRKLPLSVCSCVAPVGISSILLVMINKRILYTYKFGSPVVLLLMHLSFSIVFLEGMNLVNLLKLRAFEWSLAMKDSEADDDIVRDASTVENPRHDSQQEGGGVCTPNDARYLCVFANNTLTASYLVAMKFYFGSLNLAAVDVLRYNCVLSIPSIAILTISNGQLVHVLYSLESTTVDFFYLFLASGFMAFFVNFSTYWCTHVNSPLTTSVTGQLKNVLTTVLGMLIFPDVHINSTFLVGIGLGTVGGIMFSVHKFMESQKVKGESEADDTNEEPESEDSAIEMTFTLKRGRSNNSFDENRSDDLDVRP
eukprot:jgi/Bigna1/132817/aug1.19_g7525